MFTTCLLSWPGADPAVMNLGQRVSALQLIFWTPSFEGLAASDGVRRRKSHWKFNETLEEWMPVR